MIEKHTAFTSSPAVGAVDRLMEPLDDYLAFRRSIGFKYKSDGEFLFLFVRWLHGVGVGTYEHADHLIANRWVMSRRPEVAPKTFNREISNIVHFFNYLIDSEATHFNPFASVLPVREPKYMPFVFTIEQLFFFFDAIHGAATRSTVTRAQNYYPVFHTIYALGLRGSELCNLTLDDVDLDRNTILIRETKFFKDRLLPMNTRTHALLSEYLEMRKKRSFASKEHRQYFFITHAGRKFSRNVLTSTFPRYAAQARITQEKRTHPGVVFGTPRLHSLRHAFAVHRLLKWYRDGVEDINSKLPLLSTFMGHSNFTYTQVYLNITEEILKLASEKFEKKFDPPNLDL